MLNTDSKFTRWYQEPYAWLVAILPAIAVVCGFYTLRLAIISDDGLVTDDYYKKGLEINRVLERDDRAHALGLDTVVNIDASGSRVSFDMRANDASTLPSALRVRLMHATRAGFDRDLTAVREGQSGYQLTTTPLTAGHWYVQIETAEWRVLKSLYVSQRK